EVAPALRFGAMGDERRPHHLNAHEADQAGRPSTYHLLVDDGLAHDVGALAAVLTGPAHGHVPRLVELPLPRLPPRDAPRVLEIHRPLVRLALRHVALEPGAHLVLEGALLGRIAQVHGRLATTGVAWWPAEAGASAPRAAPPVHRRAHADHREPRRGALLLRHDGRDATRPEPVRQHAVILPVRAERRPREIRHELGVPGATCSQHGRLLRGGLHALTMSTLRRESIR